MAALATGELPVLVVNPRQLRDLAGATGNLAGAYALAGVASFNRDSGSLRRKRTVRGGRARVGAALYMGALAASRFNPVMGDLYELLLAAGKTKMLTLTACMRKLLTILSSMLKHGSSWRAARHDSGIPRPRPLTRRTVAVSAGGATARDVCRIAGPAIRPLLLPRWAGRGQRLVAAPDQITLPASSPPIALECA